jgi:hypothetical protein
MLDFLPRIRRKHDQASSLAAVQGIFAFRETALNKSDYA